MTGWQGALQTIDHTVYFKIVSCCVSIVFMSILLLLCSFWQVTLYEDKICHIINCLRLQEIYWRKMKLSIQSFNLLHERCPWKLCSKQFPITMISCFLEAANKYSSLSFQSNISIQDSESTTISISHFDILKNICVYHIATFHVSCYRKEVDIVHV